MTVDVTAEEFDVVVVGGGVGVVAAVRTLAAAVFAVALVDDRLVGGVCHYFGCSPSKTRLRPIGVLNLANPVPGVRELIWGDALNVEAVFAKRDTVIVQESERAPSTQDVQDGIRRGWRACV